MRGCCLAKFVASCRLNHEMCVGQYHFPKNDYRAEILPKLNKLLRRRDHEQIPRRLDVV